jgi:AraC-like DNA-binding protein
MATVSTDGVAAPERLSFWQHAISRVFVELDCRPVGGAPPRGRIIEHPLGPLAVSDVAASASTVVRSAESIRRSSRDHLYAVVPLASRALLEQHGRSTTLHPGDVALYDSAYPYALAFPSDFRLIVWQLPRGLLLDRAPGLEGAAGRAVSGASGLGAAVSSFLRTVAARTPELTARDELTVTPALMDLLAGAMLAGGDPDPSSVARMHVERARVCARRRLGDPTLTPEELAADAGLSPRHLRRVFAAVGTTPARFLLEERLAASARELADPARGHRSITEVWLDHGFTGAAHFSRAFRRRYGVAPREYRAAMTQRPA